MAEGLTAPPLKSVVDQKWNGEEYKDFHQLHHMYKWTKFCASDSADSLHESVVVTHVEDPYCIFIKEYKVGAQVEALENELTKAVDLAISVFSTHEYLFRDFYQHELVVAVKDGKKWKRGFILNMNVDQSSNKVVHYEILFVDYGITKNVTSRADMFPMYRKFVTELPFQAVAFRLDHVVSPDGEQWSKDTIDKTKDLLGNREFNVAKIMYDLDDNEFNWPGPYYAGLLFIGEDDLGEKLIKEQLAVYQSANQEEVIINVKNALLEHFQLEVDNALRGEDKHNKHGGDGDDIMIDSGKLAESGSFKYEDTGLPGKPGVPGGFEDSDEEDDIIEGLVRMAQPEVDTHVDKVQLHLTETEIINGLAKEAFE